MSSVITAVSAVFGEAAPVVSRRELKALMKRSNKPGLIHLSFWVLLLSLTSCVVYWSVSTIWLLLPAMFIHGVVMVHNFALLHECSHYTPFHSRRLCNILAGICGFLLFIPPRFFRYEHCDHHTFTNQQGHDPEILLVPEGMRQYVIFLSGIPYWYGQISGIVRRTFGSLTLAEKRFIPAVERAAIVSESRLMMMGYAMVIVVSSITSWGLVLLFWWLPMLLGEPVMRYIRMTEHVGRPTISDRRVNTRTLIVARIWQFLAWNMNFHAEHHYASSVPFHALPRLHEKLDGHVFVEAGGYRGAHRDIRQSISVNNLSGTID